MAESERLTHFSLFSGIGGIDLAAEWAGYETIGQCEWADYPTKVLEKHWSDVPRWRDIRDLSDKSIRERIGEYRIDLLSGGFPCQPHSTAGRRLASGDERDMWGEFSRIICETNPTWVLGENVPGILTSDNGRFFGGVLRDLAGMGYVTSWGCISASDVGARHRRNRVFIVAYSASVRQSRSRMSVHPGNPTKDTTRQASKPIYVRIREQWESEPNVGRVANGVPNRVDRLKCLGNAVVPAQVYPILKAIKEIENG